MPESVKRLEVVVGQRVRALRDDRRWTQDEFARRLRERGFLSWSHSVVAALENGGKKLDIAELVELSLTLGVPITELICGQIGWLTLRKGLDIRPAALAKLLSGHQPDDLSNADIRVSAESTTDVHCLLKFILSQITHLSNRGSEESEDPHDVISNSTEYFEGLSKWTRANQGRLECYLARLWSTDPSVIGLGSLLCWGRSVSDERDRRARCSPYAKQKVGREVVAELKSRMTRQGNRWVVHVEQPAMDVVIQMVDEKVLVRSVKLRRQQAIQPDLVLDTMKDTTSLVEINRNRRQSSKGKGSGRPVN